MRRPKKRPILFPNVVFIASCEKELGEPWFITRQGARRFCNQMTASTGVEWKYRMFRIYPPKARGR